ncbi:pyruvate kinase alpha/beta domain-containing protein [Candidatus Pyrohabitans sp.]
MRRKIVYFDSPGERNTDEVIRIAGERLREGDVRKVVVASATGATAVRALRAFSGLDVELIAVTYHAGFSSPGSVDLEEENRIVLEEAGVPIVMATHALSGVERSFSRRFGGISTVEVVAETLRALFGQGLKTCVEVAIMACDAGRVSPHEDIIALGGTGGAGVDTACVIRPANMNRFFDMRIREILCMPLR